MFGIGSLELILALFFLILPIAVGAAFVVFFLKWLNQISRDISQISRSIQSIETKLTRNE